MTRPIFARGMGTSPAGPPGANGTNGTNGLPGVNAVANDTATASYISTPSSATATALSAWIVETVSDPSSALRVLLDSLYGNPAVPDYPTGAVVPTGAMTPLTNALAASDTTRFDIVIPGDSTDYGQTGTGPSFSWTQRFRQRLRTAGYADNRGLVGVGDGADFDLDGIDPIIANTTSPLNTLSFGLLASATPGATAAGQYMTFQGKGTKCRLWMFSLGDVGSALAVSIDGAAETIYTPNSTTVVDQVMLTLGSDTTHTVKVRNLGGTPLAPPVMSTAGDPHPGTGSLPAGSYFYKATKVGGGGGESSASTTPKAATLTGTGNIDLYVTGDGQGGTFNIYRATAENGPYYYIGQIVDAPGFQSLYAYNDDGDTATTQQPPTTSTGIGGTKVKGMFVPEFLRDAGVAIHNMGVPGITGATYLGTDYAADTPSNSARLKATFGLTPSPSSAGGGTDPFWTAPDDPNGRNVGAVIFPLGINDEQQSAADNSADLKQAARRCARAAQVINTTCIIALKHFEQAAHSENAALYRTALTEVQQEFGCVLADLGSGGALGPADQWAALGYTAGDGNPHLTALAYQVQGDYMADLVLAAVARAA